MESGYFRSNLLRKLLVRVRLGEGAHVIEVTQGETAETGEGILEIVRQTFDYL